MKKPYALMLIACSLLTSTITVSAMTIQRANDVLLLSGKVVKEDLKSFRSELAQGEVSLVILAESPGGDIGAAYGIADLIRKRQIKTGVYGACSSSCALMFMGGVERKMVAGEKLKLTRLGFHGPHKKGTKEISDEGAPRLRDWLYAASDKKFDGELLDTAMFINNANDMLLFYYPKADQDSVYFCPEGAKPRPTACKIMEGQDAIKSGVLTSLELIQTEKLIPKQLNNSSSSDPNKNPESENKP
jgi:hypothetical protein